MTAIEALERPTTISKLRGFLGAVGFFRKYIQGFGQIAKPLNDMTSNKFGNCWTPEMDKTWKELKKRLTEAPILRHPDFTKPFILYTDASKKGVGAILAQHDDKAKADYVVEYFSQSLGQAQENWVTTDLECLAIVEAVRHFDGYLREKPFTIYTDHQALATLRTQQNPKGRKARWIAELKNYDFKAKHWPGRDNGIADYLSRNPTTEPIAYIEDE